MSLNIVLAAKGIASVASNIYLDKLAKRLRKKGHRVWLVCINPSELKKGDIPIYWPGPKYKILWIAYLLEERFLSGYPEWQK